MKESIFQKLDNLEKSILDQFKTSLGENQKEKKKEAVKNRRYLEIAIVLAVVIIILTFLSWFVR